MPLDDLDTPVDDSWRDLLLRGKPKKEGEPPPVIPCAANVIAILTHHPAWKGVLAHDAFAEVATTRRPPPWDALECTHPRPGPWTDADDTRLQAWLQRNEQLHFRASLGPVVEVVARQREYHPVREYLRSIEWDRQPRSLVTYIGAEDTMYARLVLGWLLVSSVARVMEPGCKVDTMVILEAGQGARKSSLCRAMYWPWFSDTPIDPGSKDAYLAMRGRWGIEWAELDSMSRAEAARVKAFVSSQVDVYRPPYGHRVVSIPRQCVHIGTTNEDEYLQDPTGGRRFHPVRCGRIDVDAVHRDRDQLFAEAVAAYDAGASWWPATAEERALCGDEQEQRMRVDAWETMIARWSRELTRERVTVDEVASGALGLDAQRLGKSEQIRIGSALKRAGWTRVRITEKGARVWAYECPKSVFQTNLGQHLGQPDSSMFPL